jgi:hypothetical protein
VDGPSEYGASGYFEIQNPPERYAVINRTALRKYKKYALSYGYQVVEAQRYGEGKIWSHYE